MIATDGKRRAWTERVLLHTIPLDKEGWYLRVYRKTWRDGSQCIDIQKWVKRDDGSMSFYKPSQYLQIPISIAGTVVEALGVAVLGGAS